MKKRISFLLVLIMLLTFLTPTISAEEVTEAVTQPTSFHAPTIRRLIEVNLELGNTDEEFYHILANAYLTDPVLLAQTIADLNSEQIDYLARAISYDLQKTGRVSQATLPEDCGGEAANAAARVIYQEAGDPANASIYGFLDAELFSIAAVAPASNIVAPTVSFSMNIPSDQTPSIAEPLNVELTLASIGGTFDSSTNYIYRIYKVVDEVTTLAATGRIAVTAGTLGTTVTKAISLNTAGECTVYAVVTISFDSQLTTSSQTLNVNGKWHITVELTANRYQLGTITLYDASGSEVSYSICLGRSSKGYAMNVTNGHTPIGVYTGKLSAAKSDTDSYGPYQVVRLTGYSGYVVRECSHRSGILIHCGKESYNSNPDNPLCPTYGCIRVTNAYQAQLVGELEDLIASGHDSTGFVTVTQDGLTDLEE